ncbi:hypothetical protein CHARACLAT_026045 [Characodon lateralis]|uniref:Uncharacterized protein n=1 Tax=Characodon lateralis TaxID=208331 RepID=A0ABU7DVJ9_9TELE|nr:hypothetical protein [Characodon lateralis]
MDHLDVWRCQQQLTSSLLEVVGHRGKTKANTAVVFQSTHQSVEPVVTAVNFPSRAYHATSETVYYLNNNFKICFSIILNQILQTFFNNRELDDFLPYLH